MDRRRWINLTSISGEDIESLSLSLSEPYVFISVNGRYKHTAPPARPSREDRFVWKKMVFKGVPVRIDLEDEPDLVLEFHLMAEGGLPRVKHRARHYGEVNVPLSDLLAKGPPGSLCHVSYQIRSSYGRPNGTLSFSYRIHQPPPPPPRQLLDLPPGSKPPPPPPPRVCLSTEVVATILAKLPAKALMKFRCVCRSWNSLIYEDSYFIFQHSNNSKEKPAYVSLSKTQLGDDYTVDSLYSLNYLPYDGSKVRKIDFGSVPYEYHYCATNSCNGLVGVYGLDEFYVANLSIMKLEKLPRGSPHVERGPYSPLAGIGFESSTAVYKAVRLFVREYKQRRPVSVGCEVFTLGGHSWMSVGDPPEPFRYMAQENVFDDPCSVVDGAMYWKVPFTIVLLTEEIALSFDVREEKFSVLLHPERSSRPEESSLVTIRGSLCIVDKLTNPDRMKIWTLKDRRSSEWVEQYTVDLSRMSPRVVEDMWPLTIDGERILLLSRSKKIYYDLMTMRIVHRTRTDHVDFELVRPYTERIVWPFRT